MLSYISSNVEQFQSAWAAVSDSTPHCSHMSSFRIFLFNRLCLAGMASLQTRHMKFCTLLGTLSPQICFQTSFCCCGVPAKSTIEFSLARNFESELTVYLPDGVKGQMILSSIGVRLKGILRTNAASLGDNNPCTKFVSHVLVIRLMSSDT